MKSFKDQMGREWIIRVDCGGLRRILDSRGVNLADTRQLESNFDLIRSDDLFIVEAVWELARPEADKQNITREAFMQAVWGEAIMGAAAALVEGMADFFRYPSARELAKLFAQALGSPTFGQPSTASPGSAASIQAA